LERVTLATAKREGWADWIRSTADERAVDAGCRFDIKRAEHAGQFFESFLCLTEGEGAGHPFELQTWQWEDVIAPCFGWLKWSDHFKRWVRRYERVFLFVSKKNGKSPLAAGFGLYTLCADGEIGGKVFSAATDREQARIVHNHAVAMVDMSPALSAACRVHRSTWTITHKASRSTYRALSAESRSKEGLNANCIVIDELHVVDEALWNVLRYAFASRAEPLLVMATTAGDMEHSVCRDQYNYAKAIDEGRVTDHGFLPIVFEAPDIECDIEDEDAIRAANPSLGVTVVLDRLKADAAEAKEHGAAAVASFRRYRLNQWVNSAQAWLPLGGWNDGSREIVPADLEGRECYAGLDLSKGQDLTAFVLCFPDYETETAVCLPYLWMPEARVEANRDSVPWREWAEKGFVKVIPGEVTDYRVLKADIRDLWYRFRFAAVAFDPWNEGGTITELDRGEMDSAGRFVHEPLPCEFVRFGQTAANFATPCEEFARMVTTGSLLHPGNECFTWQAANVQVKTDWNNNVRPVKPKSHEAVKIDGIVAAVMALALTKFCAKPGTEAQPYVGDGTLQYIGD